MPPTHIAVLGGGLTGLSSAIHLARRFPTSKITLLEKQGRLGGWVRSERVDLPQIGASVLLEGGPRSLRPNGKSVLELDEVITVPKTAPPAKARFLYIPKSNGYSGPSGLQRIPSSIFSMLSSPLASVMLPAVLFEPFKRYNRPSNIRDESVDSFFTRRLGETFARVFGSALVHGIYATDSRKLSVRAAFPSIWEAEERGRGSIVRGFLTPKKKKDLAEEETYDLGDVPEIMRGISVYSFRDGMETLTKAMERNLETTPNVGITKNAHVSSLKLLEDQEVEVAHSQGTPLIASHVVSALPLQVLYNLIHDRNNTLLVPNLNKNPYSTVHVVNMVFPLPPKDIHPEGFGYLIPRPPDGYPDASNPSASGVLGTVFDSCSLYEQDFPRTENYYNNASHTKLTMMTGGPYSKPPLPPHLSSSETDVMPPFIRNLLDQLKTQLGKELPDPVYWRIWNNEACIPTLLPGHLERMEEMRAQLGLSSTPGSFDRDSGGWKAHLAVVGAGVGGVSVGDCIEAGRQVGREWT
ncbi:Protoporphyrinogen oxidase [Psilocybe cubensis]|uniref:Protoporphyrinogen oxidase n=1 Tax=Psilocybe cubensis TaxID=181762 RepID=A0ACB8GSM7_PSICU|nr:Protoporphyrinogen oxidase [Psilocybe cubensis]KAH9478720.1 Protoporphyrinogen oxidase [Psilocybe cubensis]